MSSGSAPSYPPLSRLLTRRAVLVGGAGLALVTACGGKGSEAQGSTPTSAADGTTQSDRVLVAMFDGSNSLVPGSPQRAVFGIGNEKGALIEDVPATLSMTVTPQGGKPMGPFDVASHAKGLPRAYFPLTFTPASPGYYEVATEVEGKTITASFAVGRKEPGATPGTGDPMPVGDTPTVADTRGVDPICTREPSCTLHEVNLRDALEGGKHTALLVSTPAYCQTAICGPVLDVLLGQVAKHPDITFIHAEVYKSATDAEANGANAKLAPILEKLNLFFEPVLFLVDADGKLRERLDVIFDDTELSSALERLAV